MSEQVTTAVEPKVVQKSHFKVVGVSCQTMMDERSIKVPRLMGAVPYDETAESEKSCQCAPVDRDVCGPPNWNESRDAFYWIAAVEVDSFEKIPQDMITKTVPAHTYAMIEYDPSLHDFDPYSYLHQWIVENGYQQVEGFGFEEYQPYTGQEGRYCLYLPIK